MGNTQKPHLIACGILKREIERLRSLGELDVTVQYLSRNLHTDYGRLYKALDGALRKSIPEASDRLTVVYGDVCLGFNEEMAALMEKHGAVKVDALNCIDCLLGGGGRLLEIDPEHKILFLNPAFIQFMDRIWKKPEKEVQEMFRPLRGIILLDALGDLDIYREEIDDISRRTALPILERKNLGLEGFKSVLMGAITRNGS